MVPAILFFDDSDLGSPVLRDDLEESVGSKCEAGQSSEEL